MRLNDDGEREKVLADDQDDPPEPTMNQIKAKTIFSGITNGTERNHLLRGNYSFGDERLPAGYGYQNVGEVVQLGPDVAHIEIGDILFMSADHLEYVVMNEDGLITKLREGVAPEHGALFGMAGVALRTCWHADFRVGDSILIVGLGCIGQIASQIAHMRGAKVSACDINDNRLRVAQDIGAATHLFNASRDGWDRHVNSKSFNIVMDFAGAQGMEDQLIEATQRGGKVILVAGRSEVRYTSNLGEHHEITIRHNNGFKQTDLDNVNWLVSRSLLTIDPLVRDIVPVERAGSIYELLKHNPYKLLGTVFRW